MRHEQLSLPQVPRSGTIDFVLEDLREFARDFLLSAGISSGIRPVFSQPALQQGHHHRRKIARPSHEVQRPFRNEVCNLELALGIGQKHHGHASGELYQKLRQPIR